MKLFQKPLVVAVRQALEEQVIDAQRPTRTKMATAKRKMPVNWTKTERTAIARAIYPAINSEKFPLSRDKKYDRLNLGPLVMEAQNMSLPADRHIAALTPSIRSHLVGSLNYHHKKQIIDTPRAPAAPVVSTAPVASKPVSSDAFGIGQLFGQYIKSDSEALKSFFTGVAQTITK